MVLVAGSPYIQSVEQKLGGALAVKVQTTDTCGEMDGECGNCPAVNCHVIIVLKL